MGKLAAYSLGRVSLELEQFRDEITNLWNLGKYAPNIVTSAPPNWNARPGECIFFWPASGGTTLYFYKNSAWTSGWSVTV